jgi:hypothetical protein
MSRGGDGMGKDDVSTMDFDDRVERYVTGRMDPESIERFEEQLLHDAELLADTRAARALQDGLKDIAGGEQDTDRGGRQGGGLAVAAVFALGVAVSLMMGRVAGPEVVPGSSDVSMAVELVLTRGASGPVVHLARGTARLELRLEVPGVGLAEQPWRLAGTALAGAVLPGLEGAPPTVVLDVLALPDGDYRLVVSGTEAGDLSFGFSIQR